MTRRFLVAAGGCVLAITIACSSYDESDAPTTPANDAGTDSARPEDAGGTAEGSAEAAAPKHIRVFGGIDAFENAALVTDAYEATVGVDGSLSEWKRFSRLDVGWAQGSFAAMPDGALVIASGRRTLQSDASAPSDVADVQFAAPDPATSPWTGAPPLFEIRVFSAATFAAGRIFVSGGVSGPSGYTNAILTAAYTNGAVQPWSSAGDHPSRIFDHATFEVGGRLYVIGGRRLNETVVETSNAVDMAAIDASGTISGWASAGSLPVPISEAAALATAMNAFTFGGAGSDGIPIASVFIGDIGPDGKIAWSVTTPLPEQRASACAVRDGNVVYVLGGTGVRGGAASASVFIGRVNGASITWTASGGMPAARLAFGCALQ